MGGLGTGGTNMVVVIEADTGEQVKDMVLSRIRAPKYLRPTLTPNVVA